MSLAIWLLHQKGWSCPCFRKPLVFPIWIFQFHWKKSLFQLQNKLSSWPGWRLHRIAFILLQYHSKARRDSFKLEHLAATREYCLTFQTIYIVSFNWVTTFCWHLWSPAPSTKANDQGLFCLPCTQTQRDHCYLTQVQKRVKCHFPASQRKVTTIGTLERQRMQNSSL